MFYIIIIIGVGLDLFTKNLALEYLQERVGVFSDFLFLGYSENTGAAFSTQISGLKYLTVILIVGIFYYYFLEKKNAKNLKLLDLSFGLILAGAIGNGIERVFNEKVIDFIGVKYFAIFNLADIFISIGAIIYLYLIMKPLSPDREREFKKKGFNKK